MNTNAIDNLGTAIANGAMKAAAVIINSKKISPDIDALIAAMKEVSKTEALVIIDEMKEAQHMGEAMLSTILSAGCTDIAVKSLKKIGAL